MLHHTVTVTIPNAYVLEWTGAMVVEYLRQNEDRWPDSWEELRPIYHRQAAEGNPPWSFDELRSRVVVEWDVDVQRLRESASAADEPPFRVIYLRDGGDEHWAGYEPNEMVYRYLNSSDKR